MEFNMIVKVFTMVFIAVILFMVFNTMMGSFIQPTFSDIAHNTTMINITRYDAAEANFMSALYVVLGIFIIIPFAYLLIRLFFKREPVAYDRGAYQ